VYRSRFRLWLSVLEVVLVVRVACGWLRLARVGRGAREECEVDVITVARKVAGRGSVGVAKGEGVERWRVVGLEVSAIKT
jgi:hypothetical protein